MPPTERPPMQGVPLQAVVWADELNWHLDSLPACSGDGYVGLPANPSWDLWVMASSIPTDLPKAPSKQSCKKYTPAEK
ncbi:UNVERIFIED_CONTAM: hypothetical protein Slati_3105100 [Sesamum latifolium]|uniref:Uncharacterized protein n=1 Tax=Sesamum latifolium TaxID=2727402 RepID=A0AAW2UV14_9LAMI